MEEEEILVHLLCSLWRYRPRDFCHHFFFSDSHQYQDSRVNQVDAAGLDIGMLKEQLVKVFNLMKQGYESELDAFLEFLMWRFLKWVDKDTPGNALMISRDRDESTTTMMVKQVRRGLKPGLTSIYGPACSDSLPSLGGATLSRSLAHQNSGMVRHLEGFYRAASINLLIFLYKDGTGVLSREF